MIWFYVTCTFQNGLSKQQEHCDEKTNSVLSRVDWVGGVILLLYIIFLVYRNRLAAPWVAQSYLGAFTLSISAGIMLGRIPGTLRGIWKLMAALSLEAQ